MARVCLIVLDSFGVGEMPDAASFGDAGSNTVYAASTDKNFYMPNMDKLGFFHLDDMKTHPMHDSWIVTGDDFSGAVCRLKECSAGKDTTIGHWEIAGVISPKPLPTFPNGFPEELLAKLREATGRDILCNMPYSGTKVIEDYGKEHMESGALIVYTSADSVLQIAAHEDIVPIDTLYEYCEKARKLCTGDYAVGRIIARPFEGTPGNFNRTSRRHDYSLLPPDTTMLDTIKAAGKDVIAVGKISDIFAGKGITRMTRTTDNADGIDKTIEILKNENFDGLCFVNLVDFDMKYGHRNDVPGYAAALSYFDKKLPEIMALLQEDDILMITADHGCDPSTPSTDHSREYTPLVMYGSPIKPGTNLGTKDGFCHIAATITDYLGVYKPPCGNSFLKEILK